MPILRPVVSVASLKRDDEIFFMVRQIKMSLYAAQEVGVIENVSQVMKIIFVVMCRHCNGYLMHDVLVLLANLTLNA